jgi:hypothetical protein
MTGDIAEERQRSRWPVAACKEVTYFWELY